MLEAPSAPFAGAAHKTLTILSVAYPFATVGRNAVGGAEQVLTALDAALVQAGHRSLVLACEGSACRGTLIPAPRWEPRNEAAYAAAHSQYRRAIAGALERWPVDVVHLHGLDFAAYLPPPGPAVLATLHLYPHLYPRQALFPARLRTWLNAVSISQHRACPAGMPLLEPIPNGVDLRQLHPGGSKRGFVLALGRICQEKGFHLALDAAKAAGLPLLLGGEVFSYPEHQRYFREDIVPRLDSLRRYIGPAGLRRKRRLLAAARCVVISSRIAEACPLVALEALACGTPVAAFRIGALPEIVEHGRTGLLVDDERQMAEALHDVEKIDPAECRRAAEERFSAERMMRRYLDLYQEFAAKEVEAAPVAAGHAHA